MEANQSKYHIKRLRRRFKESNIFFQSESLTAIAAAIATIKSSRVELETYISLHPIFQYTLQPVPAEANAPQIVKLMLKSSSLVNVGPMAAVAGALADLAVKSMINRGAHIAIVENGGEISASSEESFTIGVYAGSSILSQRIGFHITPSECPIGIGTSSATVSHAISFGEADSVTVFADTSAVADAAATAICNKVQGEEIETSIKRGLDLANKFHFIRGVLIIRGGFAGSVGKIPKLVKIENEIPTGKIGSLEGFPLNVDIKPYTINKL